MMVSVARRLVAAMTGALLGAGAGILIADGDLLPLGVGAVVALAAVALSARIVDVPEEREWLLRLLALAFVLRFASAVILQAGVEAAGREGVTGDDAEYARLAWGYAQFVRGDPQPPYVPPYWNASAYLFGTYVYIVTVLFLLFGPVVLIPEIVNAGFGAATLAFLFDLARRLFGRRTAMLATAIVAVYPSLVLWSSINLKDALALFLITVTLWSLVRFGERARTWPLVVAYGLLWPMESLRRYIFAGLSFLIPLVVWIAPRMRGSVRLRWGGAATALSALFLAFSPVAGLLNADALVTLEFVRLGMSANARTGFVERPPIVVQEGHTFVVPGTPRASPTIVVVPLAARIVVGEPGTLRRTRAPLEAPEVLVRPGDIIVVGRPGTTAAPVEDRRALRDDETIHFRPLQSAENVRIRTLAYLPRGLTYALFAPVPWDLRRALDLLTVPEMLVWYVLLGSAVWTMWTERARWRILAPLVAYMAGMMFVFSLAEGNVGTLFRHRGMVIPTVAVLAAPALLALVRQVPRLPPIKAAARILPGTDGGQMGAADRVSTRPFGTAD